jgi:hypothetical protein
MQFQASGHGFHNMKKTNSYNHLQIDIRLDHQQNHLKCGIVRKDNVQTLDDKRDKT